MSTQSRFNIDYSEITILNILLFVWQLPQHLVAILIFIFMNQTPFEWKNEHTGMTLLCFNVSTSFCWSLGQFVFINPCANDDVRKHESGHSVQSLFLGPLYLLAVGIPSVILFVIKQIRKRIFKHSDESLFKWYHSHYPEKWADKLGGAFIE